MKPNAGLGKFFTGAIAGAALSFLYVVYGYQLPVVTKLLDIPKEATALAMDIVAEEVLYDADAALADQQRVIAFKVGSDPDFFREIDTATDNAFSNEVLRRRASRQANQLRASRTRFDKVLQHPALRKHYEDRYKTIDPQQIKQHMLIDAIRREPFLHQHLKKQFPGQTDEQLAAHILE